MSPPPRAKVVVHVLTREEEEDQTDLLEPTPAQAQGVLRDKRLLLALGQRRIF